MLLPQTANFTAIIGATFNEQITLYEPLGQSVWRGIWNNVAAYPSGIAVKGSNGTAYQSVTANTNIDPVTDSGVHWTPLPLFDLTGYTGVFQIGTLGSAPSLTLNTTAGGVTLGGTAGTINIVATPTQVNTFPPGRQHYYLQIISGGAAVIVPLKGQINFISP